MQVSDMKLKVGEKVYNILLEEWGTVVSIDNTDHPIKVSYNDKIKIYRKDGTSSSTHKIRVIYRTIPTIIDNDPPLLEVDTKVVVWNNGGDKKNRYFSHFGEDGRIFTFPEGSTSWSATIGCGGCNWWDNWELYQEEVINELVEKTRVYTEWEDKE